MPNYDLGTAHGKIKITADTKGAKDTEAELKKLRGEVKDLTSQLHGLEDGMLDYEESTQKSSKSIHQQVAEMRQLYATASKLKRAFDTLSPSVQRLYRNTDHFRNGITFGDLAKAAPKMLLLGAAVRKAGSSFLGINKALDALTPRTRNIQRLAGNVAVFAGGYGLIKRYGEQIGNLAGKFGIVRKAGELMDKTFLNLVGTAAHGDAPMAKFARGILRVGVAGETTAKTFDKLVPKFGRLAGGVAGVITGGALLKKGLGDLKNSLSFLGKIPKQFIAIGGAVAIASKPLLILGAKILTSTSNLALGLFNATKQLAGGFLAIPGAVAVMATAIGTATVLGKAFGKVFKDVFSADTPEDLAAAIDALPEEFKAVGREIGYVKKQTDQLGKALVGTFSQGLPEDLETVAQLIQGPIFDGMNDLVGQFAVARVRLLDFLGSKKTVQDLGNLFGYTSQTVQALGKAFVPVLAGFKDIALVGARFVRDLSQGADGLAQKFADFASKNRGNGNLLKWMQDALRGAKDLVKGTVDLGKSLGSLLTLFATGPQTNPLDTFAKSMEKFNKTVQESKAGGILHDIALSVREFSAKKIPNLKEALGIDNFKGFKDAGAGLFTALEKSATSFVKRIGEIVKYGSPIVEIFSNILEYVSPVLGKILAMSLALKGMLLALKPLKAAFISIFAAGLVGKFVKQINGAALKLATMGTAGAKLGSIFARVATFVGTVGGAVTAVAGAFTLLYLAYSEGQDQIKAAQDAVNESAKASLENVNQLKDAFTADGGIAGKNVFTQVRDDLQEMQDNIKNVIDKKPGIIGGALQELGRHTAEQGISTYGSVGGTFPTGNKNPQQEEAAALDNSIRKAESAQKGFDALKLTTEDLAKVVTGSQSAFDGLSQKLIALGPDGSNANDALVEYKKTYNEIQDTFAAAGPGSAQVAAGIQAIADAGGDASAKLDGVKQALQGLGLLQTTAIEDAFSYAQAVREIGDKVQDAAQGVEDFSTILNDKGGFNTASQGAYRLYEALQPVAEAFLRTAVSSGDAQGSYAKLVPEMGKIQEAFHLADGQVQNLLSSIGVDPQTVQILIELSGKDQVTQNLAAILLQAQAQAKTGINVPIILQGGIGAVEDAAKKITDLFGAGAVTSKNAVGLTIRPDIVTDPANLAKFQQTMSGLGVQVPGGPAPTTPATVPAAPVPAAPPPGQAPGLFGPINGGPAAPPAAAPVDTTQIDAANAKIAELQKTVDTLNANPPKVEVNADQLASLNGAIDAAIAKFNEFKQGITDSLAGAMAAIAGFVSNANAALTAAGSANYAAGLAFGNNFANGIAATAGTVAKAAYGLAQTAKAFMPGSPAKKGPLSGQGWSGISGKHFSEDFATGIASGEGGVGKASAGIAGAAGANLNTQPGGNGTGGPGSKAGGFLGELSKLVEFGQHFVDAVSKIGQAVLGFAKFISDPLGKGTFFGQAPGKAFGFRRDPAITDKQLQEKRDEALQSKLQGGAAKDNVTTEAEAQKQADAKKQAALNAEAIDRVVAGERVAPLTDEEKKAADKTPSSTDKKLTDLEKATKTPDQFDKDTRQQLVDASQKLDALSPDDLARVQSGELTLKSQDQILAELEKQTPLLGEAIDVSKKTNPGEEESIKALTTIQSLMLDQTENLTPAQKSQQSALEGISSTIKSNAGLTEGANPIDQAGQVAGAATSIAGDIFKSIQSFIEVVGATKDIADTLIRGVANTEDISRIVDDVQKFIQYAADIASTVGSIASAIGSFTGGADFGITSGIGQAASLISGALEAINGAIDLAQEAYHIAGSYVGQLLGYLSGGLGNSQLEGDVKYLLDTQTNELLAYSAQNPQDKRALPGIGGVQNAGSRDQKIGTINVYGGPGSDPRDNTRQMMYQVRAAEFAGVGATAG